METTGLTKEMESTDACAVQPSHSKYDDVFNHIQSFGPQQILLFLAVFLFILTMGTQYGLLVFAMGTPWFYCADANTTCEDNICCDNCTTYAFGEGQFTSTVTEWNLLCDRAYLAATIQSCYFGGMFFGAFFGGWMSDNFGRKPTIFLGVTVLAVVSIGSSFSDAISLLCLLRFVIGFFQMVLNVSYFVFAIEIVGPKHRTWAGQVMMIYWCIAYSTCAFLGYFIREWRMLILAVSLPGLLIVPFWKIFPGSPRWLIAHNRLDEAFDALIKFGSKTSKPIDKEALRELIQDVRKDQLAREKSERRYTQLDLLRTPKLRRRSFILFYVWVTCAIVHFGFFLYVSNLTGNLYLNHVMMNTVPLPLTFMFLYMMNKFGRRLPFIMCNTLAAVTCLLILAVPKEYALVSTALAISGKSFMSVQFGHVFLYGSELFPTVVRTNAIGCGTMTSRLGGMLTPYIAMLAQLPHLGVSIPAIIFGTITLIGSVLSLWLPETLFAKLPQTIEEAEAAKEHYDVICCGRIRHKRNGEMVISEPVDDDFIQDSDM